MLILHAHTLPPPVTVMTLTFLFAIMCVGNVYLWRVDRFLLIGSLLSTSPPTPITPLRTHIDSGDDGAGGGGILFIKETLSSPFPSTDTAITTQYTC